MRGIASASANESDLSPRRLDRPRFATDTFPSKPRYLECNSKTKSLG